MSFQGQQRKATEIARKESRSRNRIMLDYYSQSRDEINKDLQEVYTKILQETDPDNYFKLLSKQGRLDNLLKSVEKTMGKYEKLINQEQVRSARLSYINQYYYQQYLLNWADPDLAFNFIDPISVETAVFHTTYRWNEIENEERKKSMKALVTASANRPSLRLLLLKNSTKDLNRIKDTIVKGLIKGNSYTQMANDISKSTAINKRAAMRIARTEGNSNLNAGEYWNNIIAREQGLETRRQILSVLDTRTRSQSVSVDRIKEVLPQGYFNYPRGKKVVYPGSSGVPGWDINDRETVITLVEGLEPQARRARNPVTGKNEIISMNSFQDWARSHGLRRNKYGELIPGV